MHETPLARLGASPPIRAAGLAILAVLLGLGLGVAAGNGNELYVLLAPLAVIGLGLAAIRPDWGLLLLLGSVFTLEYTLSGLTAYNLTAADPIAVVLILTAPVVLMRRQVRSGGVSWVYVLLALYLLFGALSSLASGQVALAFPRLVQFGLFGLTSLAISRLFADAIPWRPVLAVLVAGAVAMSLLILYTTVFRLGFTKDISVLNTNSWGLLLDLVIPLALAFVLIPGRAKWSPLLWVLLAVLALGAAATLSRGSYLGVAAGGTLVAALSGPRRLAKILPVGAILIVLLFVFVPPQAVADIQDAHTFVDQRSYEWATAWQVFLQHPWLGLGPGSLATVVVRTPYGAGTTSDPHNFVLRVAAETGLVGLVLILGLLTLGAWRMYTNFRALRAGGAPLGILNLGMLGGTVAYLVHSLFDVFWVRGSGTLFWIYIGLAYATASIIQRGQPAGPLEAADLAPGDPPGVPAGARLRSL